MFTGIELALWGTRTRNPIINKKTSQTGVSLKALCETLLILSKIGDEICVGIFPDELRFVQVRQQQPEPYETATTRNWGLQQPELEQQPDSNNQNLRISENWAVFRWNMRFRKRRIRATKSLQVNSKSLMHSQLQQIGEASFTTSI